MKLIKSNQRTPTSQFRTMHSTQEEIKRMLYKQNCDVIINKF